MSLFRRKPKPEPPAFDTDELWRAADRLTGWTITGSAPSFDPPTLLRNAASEIERLHAKCVEFGFEREGWSDETRALLAALERITELRDSPTVPALDEGAFAREIARAAVSRAANSHGNPSER